MVDNGQAARGVPTMAGIEVAQDTTAAGGRVYLDIAERALWTFLQAFIGVLIAGDMVDLSSGTLRAGAIAGVAAVLALVKSVAATRIGDPGSAATLPRA
jgi:hypothetical protein